MDDIELHQFAWRYISAHAINLLKTIAEEVCGAARKDERSV
jgi:hypothetical protein